jgi:hypothetical protein
LGNSAIFLFSLGVLTRRPSFRNVDARYCRDRRIVAGQLTKGYSEHAIGECQTFTDSQRQPNFRPTHLTARVNASRANHKGGFMRVRPRPNGKFLTLRQAESETGIPYGRLWGWVTSGQLPRLDEGVAGRSILVRRADLDRFLDSNMTAVR